MLSMLYVRVTIKVKVGMPESFKVGWYPHKITRSSHLKTMQDLTYFFSRTSNFINDEECFVLSENTCFP